MTDYGRAYKSTFRVYRVNERTWHDGEELHGVTSGSISVTRDAGGDTIESGSMTVTGGFESGYYRIVMDTDQDGEQGREEIATLLFERSSVVRDKSTDTVSVEGQSVLYPASVERVVSGEYAPDGADGAQYAARLLRRCVKAPVTVHGGFKLGRNVVHGFGDTVLEAVYDVLDAGGFVIQIHGDGGVHLLSSPVDPKAVIDEDNTRMIVPGIKHGYATLSVPNRYIADDELERAVVVNDDPESPVSVTQRGYYHDKLDTSPCPVDGETLERYARRRLEELSTVYDSREYTREWIPNLYPCDIVKASVPALGLDGNLRVTSQSITCDHGVTVSEKACKEVKLWR